jgi:hypothetical protein
MNGPQKLESHDVKGTEIVVVASAATIGHIRTSIVAGGEPFERQDVLWKRSLTSYGAVQVRARTPMG